MSSQPLQAMSLSTWSVANPVISRLVDDGTERPSSVASSAQSIVSAFAPSPKPQPEPAWSARSGPGDGGAVSGSAAVAQRQLTPDQGPGPAREAQDAPFAPYRPPASLAPSRLPLMRPATSPGQQQPMPPTAEPAVQRAEDPPPPPSPPVAPSPPSTGGEPAAPAPAMPPAGGGQNLDELGRQLYDRIRDRLRAELRLDRERAGMASDRIG